MGKKNAVVRRWLVGTTVVFAIAAVVCAFVLLVVPMLRTPRQAAADAAPPPPAPITAKAERRALIAKVVMRAAVIPGASIDLKPSDALAAAGMVVTSIPASTNTPVETGTVVAEANGEPLIAMNWPFPAYRDIQADDTGPDVVQLQKTLGELGYATGTSGKFDALTRSGLRALYADRGYATPAIQAANMGAASGAGSSSSGSKNGSNDTSGSSSSAVVGQKEVFLPARDVLDVPNPSSRLTSIPIKVGQKITADTILAKLDGQTSTVLASTTADRAAKIKPGSKGTLTGAAGDQYSVTVTAVASGIADVPGLGQGMRIDLGFADPAKTAPLTATGTTLKLEVTTGSTPEGLVVPITAVYSTPDGNSYVIPASDSNARISVTLGANVDGWVEVKPGSSLKEGDLVVLGTASSG